MSFEAKLPAAFVLVMTLMALMNSVAVYREVKRSTAEEMLTRLKNVGAEVARIAGGNNRQASDRIAKQLDSLSAEELTKKLAADSTPTFLLGADGTTIVALGKQTDAASQSALRTAIEDTKATHSDASYIGRIFRDGEATRYWVVNPIPGKAAQPTRYLARLSVVRSNPNASRALQSLIGDTNVFITNNDIFNSPWMRLEGEPVKTPTGTSSDSTSYTRSDSTYVFRKSAIPGTAWFVVTEGYPSAIRARAYHFAMQTMLSTIWLLAVGALIVWFLAAWIIRPLRQLADAALAIGAGDYSARVSIEATGAVGQLASAFNQMAGEVERGRRELDLRVRDRTAELQIANDELQSFSYSVSHDLRSPLRSIDGFSQAMLEDYAPQLDATAQDYLKRLRGGAQRMGTLIDDLLVLSRVARQTTEPTDVDVSRIAWDVVEELRYEDPDRCIDVSIQEGMHANADPGLMRIVLQNLVGNAWKFSAQNPSARVEVTSSGDNGQQVISVRDNGAGFDMEHAQQLFGAFQRLHSAREFSGTGIGLATVRRAVSRMGGHVWADAAAGKGATFSFTIKDERDAEFGDSSG